MMLKLPPKEGLEYKVMDVSDMRELSSNSFDAIIDKGTMDSMLFVQYWNN